MAASTAKKTASKSKSKPKKEAVKKSASSGKGNAGKQTDNIMDVVGLIEEKAHGRKIKLGDMLEALESSGYGPLLIIPALIIILPTGAIPFVPDVCNIVIVLISGQIAFGRDHPWIPDKLKKLSISVAKTRKALDKAKPALQKIDDFSKKRLRALTSRKMYRIVAIIIMLTSGLSIGIGVIPYVPAALALPTLLFAIGLTVRDGLFMLLGFMFLAAAGGVIYAAA